MANITKITVAGTDYDVKDTVARQMLDELSENVEVLKKGTTQNVSIVPELRNGSPANSGNTSYVSIKDVIPFNEAKRFIIKIKRPLSSEDNVYQLSISTYKVDSGVSSQLYNQRVASDRYEYADGNTYVFSTLDYGFNPLAKSFAFGVTEYNIESDTYVPLRVSDFSDNYIEVVYDYHYVAEEYIANEHASTSTYNVGDYATYNGSLYKCTIDVDTPGKITSYYWKKINITDDIKELDSVFSSQLALCAKHGLYVLPTKFSRGYVDTTGVISNNAAPNRMFYSDMINVDSLAGVQCPAGYHIIFYYYNNNNEFETRTEAATSKDIIFMPYGAYAKCIVAIKAPVWSDNLTESDFKLLNSNVFLVGKQVLVSKSELNEITGCEIFSQKVYSGSIPNAGNKNAVCTGRKNLGCLPVTDGDIVSLIINKELTNQTNHFVNGYAFLDSEKNRLSYVDYSSNTWYENIVIPDQINGSSVKYVAWTISEYNSNNEEIALDASTFGLSDVCVLVRHSSKGLNKDIKNLETQVNDLIPTVEENGNHLTALFNNINNVNNNAPIISSSIVIPAGEVHSSNKDRVSVYISKNQNFKISVNLSNNVLCQIFIADKSGVSTALYNSRGSHRKTITATKDIYEIGVYVDNTNQNTDTTMTFKVYPIDDILRPSNYGNQNAKLLGVDIYYPEIYNGTVPNPSNAYSVSTGASGDQISIPVQPYDIVSLEINRQLTANGNRYVNGYSLFDSEKNRITKYDQGIDTWFNDIEIPNGISYISFSIAEYDQNDAEVTLRNYDFDENDVVVKVQHCSGFNGDISDIKDFINAEYVDPVIYNGTVPNSGNEYCVCLGRDSQVNISVSENDSVSLIINKPQSITGYHYTNAYAFYNENKERITYKDIDKNTWFDEVIIPSGIAYISWSIGEYNDDGEHTILRASDFAKGDVRVLIKHSNGILKDIVEINNRFDNIPTNSSEEKKALYNARNVGIRTNTTPTLTLLHFSDIHGDAAALKRIVSKSTEYKDLIDDMICTGDIVANSQGNITSWWNPNILTCIGNHDSALYSNGTYDWTNLSMADRDNYYIKPFEQSWGTIGHTEGTSYYYKDYPEQKVRLIVIDSMLYSVYETDTTLGETQTAWLSNLMAETVNSENEAYGYHVLIAAHAPYGYKHDNTQDGARSVDCSFGKYFTTNPYIMPQYSDCNTPKSVIDAVTAAQANSAFNFIGYLCGHTHQDNIWDCLNNGKQLMYCVTCAAVATTAQWANSDQYRDEDSDAYNLVTIDTVNKLVKIVRGGGANMDKYMRTRKQICFHYGDGKIYGEEK